MILFEKSQMRQLWNWGYSKMELITSVQKVLILYNRIIFLYKFAFKSICIAAKPHPASMPLSLASTIWILPILLPSPFLFKEREGVLLFINLMHWDIGGRQYKSQSSELLFQYFQIFLHSLFLKIWFHNSQFRLVYFCHIQSHHLNYVYHHQLQFTVLFQDNKNL